LPLFGAARTAIVRAKIAGSAPRASRAQDKRAIRPPDRPWHSDGVHLACQHEYKMSALPSLSFDLPSLARAYVGSLQAASEFSGSESP